MLLKNWSEHFSSEYLIWGGIHPFCSNLYSLSYRAPSLTAFVKLIWCHFWSQSVQGWFKVAAKLSFVTEGRQKAPSGQKMEKRAARGQRLHEPCIPPLHYFSQGKNFQQRHPPFAVIKMWNLTAFFNFDLMSEKGKIGQSLHGPMAIGPCIALFLKREKFPSKASPTEPWPFQESTCKHFKCHWPLIWTKHT